MRLLYVTNQISGAGGLERVLSIKTNYLIEKYNYEIHIITLNQKKESLFYEFNKNVKYYNINARGNLVSYFANYKKGLNTFVKKIKPDVISVCDDGLKGFFVPLVIGKPCPMVYERHASKNIELKHDNVSFKTKVLLSLKFRIMEWGAKRYDRFVVLTNGNKKEWSLPNINVISNPLSFNPKEKARLKNKVVLAVGTQNYQKGYDRLLRIWSKVSEKYPDWTLKIYGKIDEKLELVALTKSLKIEKSTEFHSPVKDVMKQYLDSSIYVMSSRSEGFGMVLIEAMACGVPTVAFDCPGGPKDIIRNGKGGFLVPNNDNKYFVNRIIKLIEDEEFRVNMGLNAIENVGRYLPEKIIIQWDDLFKRITNP